MNKRKVLVGGLLATAAIGGSIALASSANASVAVNNGTGFVGKGDVQTALGYANDAAFQKDASKITFTTTGDTMTTVVTGPKCAPINADCSLGEAHVLDPFVAGNFGTPTVAVTVTPKVSGGKVTGYNLTGTGAVISTTAGGTDYNVGHYCRPVSTSPDGWMRPT
jgi:hypothetical protein